ncbi:hypothetical protein TIFTF001_049888 [Ficus carica]|uniref:Uncharacterized protein n=1 Tax=Ficus carica TaxID=3494 RepID=A0AA87YZC2_FICCA|nr:hypothetical protein TIFTF001_049888 [Ficus carica]
MKSLQTQLAALRVQTHSGFSAPSQVPWQFTTIPKEEQPLPIVPPREDHVLRLKRLFDQDQALRLMKGKQKASTSSQMMVQKAIQNPLTKMIQTHRTEQLPQVQLHQINTPSDEESAPEDSNWSSKVSEQEEPTSPQPIMMNEPTMTKIPDPS